MCTNLSHFLNSIRFCFTSRTCSYATSTRYSSGKQQNRTNTHSKSARMMTAPEHDQDSMMALEALLNIKSNNNNSCSNNGNGNYDNDSSNRVILSQAIPAPALTAEITLIPNNSVLNLSHHFIPMHVVSTQSRFGPHIEVSSGLGEINSPLSPATIEPRSIGQETCLTNDTTTTTNNSSCTRESTPSLKLEFEEAPEIIDAVVRQEQIDAALRSKPQRGKKRDNLARTS